jgi:hypothetical protein
MIRGAPHDLEASRSCTSTCTWHEHVYDQTNTGELWD